MRPNKKEEGRRWFVQAERDFNALKDLIAGGHYHLVCFNAQQVAEKALKSFLYHQGKEFVFTHSVTKLCEEAAKYDHAFVSLRKEIKTLDTYYLEARYPNSLVDNIPAEFFDEDDAKEAIRMAKRALEFVRERVKLD
jgi:HEPN domain-containing protein